MVWLLFDIVIYSVKYLLCVIHFIRIEFVWVIFANLLNLPVYPLKIPWHLMATSFLKHRFRRFLPIDDKSCFACSGWIRIITPVHSSCFSFCCIWSQGIFFGMLCKYSLLYLNISRSHSVVNVIVISIKEIPFCILGTRKEGSPFLESFSIVLL